MIMDEKEFPKLPVTPSESPAAKKKTMKSVKPASSNADFIGTMSQLINERSDCIEKLAIKICKAVLPEDSGRLSETIDIAHRLGKKSAADSRPRPIILQFTSRMKSGSRLRLLPFSELMDFSSRKTFQKVIVRGA
ncbi:hypothetical protein PO909_003937 [Leuciscus waleckii]